MTDTATSTGSSSSSCKEVPVLAERNDVFNVQSDERVQTKPTTPTNVVAKQQHTLLRDDDDESDSCWDDSPSVPLQQHKSLSSSSSTALVSFRSEIRRLSRDADRILESFRANSNNTTTDTNTTAIARAAATATTATTTTTTGSSAVMARTEESFYRDENDDDDDDSMEDEVERLEAVTQAIRWSLDNVQNSNDDDDHDHDDNRYGLVAESSSSSSVSVPAAARNTPPNGTSPIAPDILGAKDAVPLHQTSPSPLSSTTTTTPGLDPHQTSTRCNSSSNGRLELPVPAAGVSKRHTMKPTVFDSSSSSSSPCQTGGIASRSAFTGVPSSNTTTTTNNNNNNRVSLDRLNQVLQRVIPVSTGSSTGTGIALATTTLFVWIVVLALLMHAIHYSLFDDMGLVRLPFL